MNRRSPAATKMHAPERPANVARLFPGHRHPCRRRPGAGGGRYRDLPEAGCGTRSKAGRGAIAAFSAAHDAEAEKLNPEGWQVANYRCITYAELGKFAEALADCNATLAKTPTSTYTLTNRGNVYLAKGDLDAALKDYNEALKINPNYIRAHAYRGQLLEKRRDAAAVLRDAQSRL